MIEVLKSKRRGRRYLVELSDGSSPKLGEETVFKHGVFEGRAFTPERWVEVLDESRAIDCYAQVLSLLAGRPHTTWEVCGKLIKRNYAKRHIDPALAKADMLGLLNDGVFARMYVEEKLAGGSQGRRRIAADLGRRGISRQQIEAAFEGYAQSYGSEAEWEGILRVARQKWTSLRREEDPWKRRHKLLAFLANRGFDRDICYRALEQCVKGED